MEKSRWTDFAELSKLRLLSLVLITTGLGYYLAASQAINLLFLFNTILGTACVGAGANALNQWYERKLDAKMFRTRNRPIPSGRLSGQEALGFGILISLLGLGYLYLFVNPLTAAMGLLTWSSYLFVYTPLKQKTVLNTWVGAIPGAIPPVMGWTAARGNLDWEALTIFGILFFWQMPHFFAIAWMYREDYAKGGFRMLPLSDDSGKRTGRHMLLNAGALLFVSVLPYFIQQSGPVYLGSAILLGIGFMIPIVFFLKQCTQANARRVFFASIFYLPFLLTLLVIDKI